MRSAVNVALWTEPLYRHGCVWLYCGCMVNGWVEELVKAAFPHSAWLVVFAACGAVAEMLDFCKAAERRVADGYVGLIRCIPLTYSAKVSSGKEATLLL